MVVDFVKSFGKVYGTQVRGTTAMNAELDQLLLKCISITKYKLHV